MGSKSDQRLPQKVISPRTPNRQSGEISALSLRTHLLIGNLLIIRFVGVSFVTLRERIDQYQQERGIDTRWIKYKIGRKELSIFPLFLLPRAFIDWLSLHDAHHLITGYDTDLKGEAEIAAWVLARNGLNLGGNPRWLGPMVYFDTLFTALLPMLFMPRRVVAAYKLGKTQFSLHHLTPRDAFSMKFEEAEAYVRSGQLPELFCEDRTA